MPDAQVVVLLLTVFVDLIIAVGVGCAVLVRPHAGQDGSDRL